jgi:catechol 2,3-dioxygenase-like lactoylglutathione lyase family enzyme
MADIVKRTTLMVRDAERAALWYERVFEMSRWMDTAFTLSGRQLAAGNKGDLTRLLIMKAEHDEIGMIGLLQWLQPEQDAPAILPGRVQFGAPIFVVAAQDARRTYEAARAMGSHIYSEPQAWSVTGSNGETLELLGTSFFDLDGYFFEVNQTLNVVPSR